MSNRLNQDREEHLQPKRIASTKQALVEMGFEMTLETPTELRFMFKGELVRFFPYSGWHSGKSIKDGRGFNNLIKQLKDEKHIR